jgi:NifB/MoaA-like Fe-S oxidoreductase
LTEHRQGLQPLTPVDAAYAARTIDLVAAWQRQIKKSKGTPFCYLGDEFYILAGRPIPGRSHYGNFPIIENGVGMVRRFLDEFRVAMRRSPKPAGKHIRGTIVTGKLFFPILRESVEEMNARFNLDLKCLPVPSLFLGRSITVAGLLAGSDIYVAAKDKLQGDFLVVPSEAMIGNEGLFLDDWQRKDLESRLQVPVLGGGYHVPEFFKTIFGQSSARQKTLRPPKGRGIQH